MLSPDAHVPLYLQLAQLLRQDIMSGKYLTGDTLPSENMLNRTYGVSGVTVRKATQVLRDEGLVRTRRGAGTVVAAVPPKITIETTRGTTITARMPTRDEREALGITEGVPIISVRGSSGEEHIYYASRAEVKTD